jgi:D-alanine-D-alanine ligase
VSVDSRRIGRWGSCFLQAASVRDALRITNIDATLFSVSDGLPRAVRSADHPIIFPIETVYPWGEYRTDRFGLRRAAEVLGIPTVGSSYAAVVAASRKELARVILASSGVRVPRGFCLRGAERLASKDLLDMISLPAVVKPAFSSGGSFGVRFMADVSALREYLSKHAASAREPLLIEEYVQGREATAWVVGTGRRISCACVIAIDRLGRRIFSRASKAGHPLRGVKNETPELTSAEKQLIGQASVRAHVALKAYSYSRVDVILSERGPVILEVNTQPNLSPSGCLSISHCKSRTYADIMRLLVSHAIDRGFHSRAVPSEHGCRDFRATENALGDKSAS